tara:strand:+ start:1705 stop:2823 length:1119 start_codon:yes stop_codon:yes gene_type:complete
MPNVLIFGAGSIGNHLAYAASQKKWNVSVTDKDINALYRMKKNIYPSRYGCWNEKINLIEKSIYFKKFYDYIFIGTPPDTHIDVAIKALRSTTCKTMMIEKPLSTPELSKNEILLNLLDKEKIECFVGYTHAASKVFSKLIELKNERKTLGKLNKLTIKWKEHWEGIFKAHPWLNGPSDSYLGQWKKGGGALGEHSHGLNLWIVISKLFGMGKIIELNSEITYKKGELYLYDSISKINFHTEKGLIGTLVQDVITDPPEKIIFAEFENANITIEINKESSYDILIYEDKFSKDIYKYEKTRPDDFYDELNHIEEYNTNSSKSPLSIHNGLETMLIISAAHISGSNLNKSVKINYSKGYTNNSISINEREKND